MFFAGAARNLKHYIRGVAAEGSERLAIDRAPGWNYSASYESIQREGTQRPPPSFGAPALAWHIGIWPKAKDFDIISSERLDALRKRSALRRNDDDWSEFDGRVDFYNEVTEKLFAEINELLTLLQSRGRVVGSPLSTIVPSQAVLAADLVNKPQQQPRRPKIYHPQSTSFTLWWQDESSISSPNSASKQPNPTDLRVLVQAQCHVDYVTISFYVDVLKPWSMPRFKPNDRIVGRRRSLIKMHFDTIQATMVRQIAIGATSRGRHPEELGSPSEAQALLSAANLCYAEIWQDFANSFGIPHLVSATPETGALRVGEVFASFQTVLMSDTAVVDGLASGGYQAPGALQQQSKSELAARSVSAVAEASRDGFKRFNPSTTEPADLVQSIWPFIRRMEPAADEREFIACGVFDWRALYISALGTVQAAGPSEETSSPQDIIPFNALPVERNSLSPSRQLIITKGEPHRQQVGRILERINSIGTLRLAALRNWNTIQAAGINVRILGDQLDNVLTHWSKERTRIDRHFRRLLSKDAGSLDTAQLKQSVATPREQARSDDRIRSLNDLIDETEMRLIQIGADLDAKVGQHGSGALLYVINRSRLFSQEFHRLLLTLKQGNVETWVTYSQFVDRGLGPILEQIERTGVRLISLRDRLQSVTEMIQTSALIVQTQATQENTQTLRRIASNAFFNNLSMFGILLGLAVQMLEPVSPKEMRFLQEVIMNQELSKLSGLTPSAMAFILLIAYAVFVFVVVGIRRGAELVKSRKPRSRERSSRLGAIRN